MLLLDGTKLSWYPEELAKWRAGEDFPPIHVEVSVTGRCNYRCPMCYASYRRDSGVDMDIEVFFRVLAGAEMGIKSCLIAGDGEPLMHPQWDDIAYTIRANANAPWQHGKKPLDMALNTNGFFLTKERTEVILPMLTWIRFSVMGGKPESYARLHGTSEASFAEVYKNIEYAVKFKKDNNLKVTIGIQQVWLPDAITEADVNPVILLARNLGVDYCVLKPHSYHPDNRGFNNQNISSPKFPCDFNAPDNPLKVFIRNNAFAEGGKRNYDKCLGLPFICQISADGGVFTCCAFFGVENYCYGNLHNNNLTEIWYSTRAKEIRNKIAEEQDVHSCMSYCRMHQVNRYLWKLTHPPEHLTFV